MAGFFVALFRVFALVKVGPMQSQSPSIVVINSQLPRICRICGQTLILAFLVLLVSIILPINPRSSAWGLQVSSRIVDTAAFPLLGVALLRLASFLQPEYDPINDPSEAMDLASERHSAVRFCRLGVFGLALLAIWQIPLLIGSVTNLDQQSFEQTSQLDQQLRRDKALISQAPPDLLQREWQRVINAGAPGFSADISDPEQQREGLLNQLEQQQQELRQSISNQTGQSRFALTSQSLRILLLCLVYIWGFRNLSKRMG
jgi:hypothetical protein